MKTPTKSRRKISASYSEFITELERLRKFDKFNQEKFANAELTLSQIHLLVETIFFNSFRTYEGFLREVFLLYCQEKKTRSNKKVKSYLKPKHFHHAEDLIKSSMSFLDWTSPDTVITRAELYLEEGFPVKSSITIIIDALRDYKKIRNHIAHNSSESFYDYQKVLRKYYGVIPLISPTPGEYLLKSSTINHGNYVLLDFFDNIKILADEITK